MLDQEEVRELNMDIRFTLLPIKKNSVLSPSWLNHLGTWDLPLAIKIFILKA